MRESRTQQTYKERVLAVLVHIQTHLDEALRLEDLAAVAYFSPYHFHRIFRGMVGESVMEHIRRLRLERAVHRLKFSDRPVTQIAFEAGYETHEAFTRAFRAMFGESPSGFREIHQVLPQKRVPSGVHFAPDGRLEDFEAMQTGDPPMDVRIEKVDAMRVAFMRHVGPYDQVGDTWAKLMERAGPRGMLGPQMTTLAVLHDDPEVTPPERIRYDACLLVGGDFEPEGEVGVQEIEGGDYAITTHRGPYATLGETYARLCGEWLPNSGRELRSKPGLEFYRNSPQCTAPENLITDIYMPMEPQ